MRKSRFLISLIAATAIGLSGVGCESSDSGAVRDTSDIANAGGDNNPDERRNMREYLLVAQRGLEVPAANFDTLTDRSLPTVTGRGSGVTPMDEVGVAAGLLFELTGVTNVPRPNLNITAPGDASSQTPFDTSSVQDASYAGFHQVYTSPSGRYVVALSRAKDNINGVDGARSGVQIFQVDTPSAEVTFPPQPALGPTPERTSKFFLSSDQGEFASGVWSRDGNYFYFSLSQRIWRAAFTESNGSLGISNSTPSVNFPLGGSGINNAAHLLASFDGNYIFALDNANGAIVTYTRDLSDGTLTETATLPTVSDPRGFTLDRTGTFLYVAGRESQQLAGYRVGTDGSLTAIDLFPAAGLGAVPATLSSPLGDVAANPRQDQLFVGAYTGFVSGYVIDVTTGALSATSEPGQALGGHRNLANLEVEPTGQFVVAAFEHDFDTFQDFVTPANGFAINESSSNVFANTDSTTNGSFPLSGTPNLDRNGRVAYVFPTTEDNAFAGSIQGFRILDAAGNVSAEDAVEASNPYGLGFFQLVIQAPVPADEPIVP